MSAVPPPFVLSHTERAASTPLSLATLLAPLELDHFLGQYWEQWPLHVARNRPDYFAGLLSLRDFDALCTHAHLRPDDMRVTRPGQSEPGALDACSLGEQFAQGATILLLRLHLYCEAIAFLCRDMVDGLGQPLKINAYLTPANSQGVPPHFDTHDVFILQLEGTKAWRIHAPAVDTPLPEHWFAVHDRPLGMPLHEVELQPGDLLYLPRGYVHEARTSERASLHLTAGVETLVWRDLLVTALTDVAEQQSSFRQAVPPLFFDGRGPTTDSQERFRLLLSSFAAHASFSDAIDKMAERLIARLAPLPTGHLLQLTALDTIGLDSVLRRRPGMICHVRECPDGVAIQYPGSSVRGPQKIAAALRFVATADGFAVRDLPGLSAEGKLTLARRLISSGLLEMGPECTKTNVP